FFFSSRRRHTRSKRDWSSDVCSSDLYVRRVAPGGYSWLPLGMRVLRNVEAAVREEMDAIGAQEIQLPALLPKEPYETSGRWSEYGPASFRLKDRRTADYLLGPTHE